MRVSRFFVHRWLRRLNLKLMEGKVIVQALEVKENQIMDFKRPVRCVALDPEYAKSSSRRVVSGGMAGQLVLSEKGILSVIDS